MDHRCFHPITQASQTQGEEPEADKPSPSAAQNQSEPTKKKISYTQLVKEGRRFNIDLVSKVTHRHDIVTSQRCNITLYNNIKIQPKFHDNIT